jgi:hypothetical protein
VVLDRLGCLAFQTMTVIEPTASLDMVDSPGMPRYHFAIFNGERIEDDLGETFADDAGALAHSRQVVRELTHGDPTRFTGWTMEVTEGSRIVGTIPCKPGDLGDEEKTGWAASVGGLFH